MSRRSNIGMAMAMVALLATPAAAGDAPPRRIVSANLCADRLALQLADRENVISVSHFAADPAVSTVAADAMGIRVNRGNVEDIASLHPDLVILGAFTAMSTAAMLRSLGITVHELPAVETVDAVRAAIRGLARDLGTPERAERMIATMDARLAALPVSRRPVRAAVYQAGGWSAGRGTMADDLFTRIGFINITTEAGVAGFGALPLETLVAAMPDVIVVEAMGEEAPSVAGDLLHHPVLTHGPARFLRLPMRLWACPDPALVDAAAMIAGAAP